MAMEITARLDAETVTSVLRSLTPLTVHLDDDPAGDRWFRLDPPDEVAFIAGQGLRVHATAAVQWTVAGLRIPFTIQSLQVMLRPLIVEAPAGGRLVFRASIEEADLKNVPQAIDAAILDHVNARLALLGDKLGWNFARTLTHSIAMPAAMEPVEAFLLGVRDGAVEVLAGEMRLSVKMPVSFSRRAVPPTQA